MNETTIHIFVTRSMLNAPSDYLENNLHFSLLNAGYAKNTETAFLRHYRRKEEKFNKGIASADSW